jgi:hypothetical protein
MHSPKKKSQWETTGIVQSILSVIFSAIRNSILTNSERGRKLREGKQKERSAERKKKRREKLKRKK